MSSFSKEYIVLSGFEFIADFCYLDEFKHLEPSQTYEEICEGLGTHGILNNGGKPYFILNSKGEIQEYYEMIEQWKENNQ